MPWIGRLRELADCSGGSIAAVSRVRRRCCVTSSSGDSRRSTWSAIRSTTSTCYGLAARGLALDARSRSGAPPCEDFGSDEVQLGVYVDGGLVRHHVRRGRLRIECPLSLEDGPPYRVDRAVRAVGERELLAMVG